MGSAADPGPSRRDNASGSLWDESALQRMVISNSTKRSAQRYSFGSRFRAATEQPGERGTVDDERERSIS